MDSLFRVELLKFLCATNANGSVRDRIQAGFCNNATAFDALSIIAIFKHAPARPQSDPGYLLQLPAD